MVFASSNRVNKFHKQIMMKSFFDNLLACTIHMNRAGTIGDVHGVRFSTKNFVYRLKKK